MRLFGTEPDPEDAQSDRYTFGCPKCSRLEVRRVRSANNFNRAQAKAVCTPDIFYLTGDRGDRPNAPTQMANATRSQTSKDPSPLSGEKPKSVSIKFMGLLWSFAEYKATPQRIIIETKPTT